MYSSLTGKEQEHIMSVGCIEEFCEVRLTSTRMENYFDLTLNATSPAYIGARLAQSKIIKVEAGAVKDTVIKPEKGDKETPPVKEIGNPVEQILGKGMIEGTFTLEGGSDGSIAKVNAGTFIGKDDGPDGRTGIQSFLENNNVNIMAVPGVTIPEVVVALVAHCENTKSRFAVIDMPKDMNKTDELINYRGMIDSTYAAMYHPWIQVFDRGSNKPDFVPPSGAVIS